MKEVLQAIGELIKAQVMLASDESLTMPARRLALESVRVLYYLKTRLESA